MPRRLRLLALVFAAFISAAVAGCADDVSPAVRIGDLKISNDTFLDEMAEWVGNEAAVDQSVLQDSSPGTYPLELTRQLLQQRIDFELHNLEFERLGLQLDDAMRDRALTIVFGDPSAAEEPLSGFSDEFAQQYTDDVARQIVVSDELGEEGYGAWREQAYAETDIEVSPRYGTWDSDAGQIVPPPGPSGSSEPSEPVATGS